MQTPLFTRQTNVASWYVDAILVTKQCLCNSFIVFWIAVFVWPFSVAICCTLNTIFCSLTTISHANKFVALILHSLAHVVRRRKFAQDGSIAVAFTVSRLGFFGFAFGPGGLPRFRFANPGPAFCASSIFHPSHFFCASIALSHDSLCGISLMRQRFYSLRHNSPIPLESWSDHRNFTRKEELHANFTGKFTRTSRPHFDSTHIRNATVSIHTYNERNSASPHPRATDLVGPALYI